VEEKKGRKVSDVAMKVGVASAIAIGAVVSGLLISRGGRKLVRELWQGKRRTRLEDRILDRLWNDRVLARREIDVQEISDGVLVITGTVRSRHERGRALALAESVKGVTVIDDRLIVDNDARRRKMRVLRREIDEPDEE
jgi:osmotically-inducible protein OsmY